MRSIGICLVLACPTASVWSQELVPNGSFEQATGCPVGPGEISLAAPWIQPTLGTSDYFNPCNTTPDSAGVPDNAVGTQDAFEGSSYAGMILLYPAGGAPGYREYVQAMLVGGPLEADKTYRFEMHLSLAEDSSAATDRIGAYFSPTAVSSATVDPLPFVPQIETAAGTYLTDLIEWMDISDTFVAAGGEEYVTIGNFHDLSTSGSVPAGLGPAPPLHPGTAYYYLDGVSLQCEPCTEPPMDMTAWWPLDETVLGLAADIVGAQHGVHVDAPVPTTGYVDGALDFLGGSVSVPTSPGLEHGTSDFTLDAWVRADSLGTDQTLFSKIATLDPATGPGYALRLNADGTVSFVMVDDTLAQVTGDSLGALTAGAWSHVTVTVDRDDPAGGRVHVDDTFATFDPTPASGSLTNALPLLFATDGGAGVGADLIGGLDEVEVFHRALHFSEVDALYRARTSGKCKAVLEVPQVTGVPITTGTVITVGTLTNSGGTTGTFTFAAKGEAAGTRCGKRPTTVAGPSRPRVLTPGPLRVDPGQSAQIQIELDVPPGLGGGELACYSVTVTHLETGRTFLARGGLRARYPRTGTVSGPSGPLQERDGTR